MKDDIKRGLEHLGETNKIRRVFWQMDDKVDKLTYGIRQGDDAVVVGDTIINMEGPYPMKIGRKTGLAHSCSDIVIMGGKPLYAFNSMQVDSIQEAKEVSEELKKQSNGLGVPIVGGNTQMENGLMPCVSFTVVGKLVAKKPIADAGCQSGDKILMLGDIMEGSLGERVYRAKVKFKTFLELVEKKVEIHAAKDASRGGWFGNLTEMLVKSRRGIKITAIPYPRITRYMGTYLLSVPKKEVEKIVAVCAKNKCPVVEVGEITSKPVIKMGGKTLVTEKKLTKIIHTFPYKKAKT